MNKETIEKAASQFGTGSTEIEPLGEGLIHRTFKINYKGSGNTIVLQCINQRTFTLPENVILNYRQLYLHLENNPEGTKIPPLVPTHSNKFYWIDDEDNFWRASCYEKNALTIPFAETREDAYRASRAFAGLTGSLAGFNLSDLYLVLPDFHNLAARYQQFEEAIKDADIMRLLRATHLISELRQRKLIRLFYDHLSDESNYPTRLMHHDGKISNILFDQTSREVLCPVDLDTVMPGKFFSDLGEMIRTTACSVDENSTAWESISIRGEFYMAVLCGYLDGIGNMLTLKEKENIHYSGLLMIYMQALRYVTDFLKNDIYYQTAYPEQNLNRALNQFILLEQLELFLESRYHFSPANLYEPVLDPQPVLCSENF